MDDDAADAFEKLVAREWHLFWHSKDVDSERIKTGPDHVGQVWLSFLQDGEAFTLFPHIVRRNRPISLTLQNIEADRIVNYGWQMNQPTLVSGIEKDYDTGAPVAYHILDQHPGNMLFPDPRMLHLDDSAGVRGEDGPAERRPPVRAGAPRPDARHPVPYRGHRAPARTRQIFGRGVMAALVAGLHTGFIYTEEGDGAYAIPGPTPTPTGRDAAAHRDGQRLDSRPRAQREDHV